MKKVYSLVALALCSATFAQAQVTEDVTFDTPWNFNEIWSPDGLVIANATVKIDLFSLNYIGLPKSSQLTNEWCPITLSNGGAVKFFDCPQYQYVTEEAFNELDAEKALTFSYSDIQENYSQQISNDWIIEGKGNAIYLDSYCIFGGTVSGGSSENPAELTIYCTNKSTIATQFGTLLNESNPNFYGTVYLKTLDGYSTDTIFFNSTFAGGNAGISTSYPNAYMTIKYYATSSTVFDISGANNPVLYMDYANTVVPVVRGEGTIYAQRYPYFNGWIGGRAVYDCVINGGDQYTGYDFEAYGGDLVFNKPVNYIGTGKYFYVRSGAQVYNNCPEPSFSNISNGISQRGTGITGGTGYWDTNYSPSSGRLNTLSAGYPYDTVGQMTWKNVWVYLNNIVRYDFDNEGHCDIINIADSGEFHMYEGQNEIYIGLPENYTPKAGNYKVINGNIDASMATYVDTIGYEIWDNNGCAYVIRTVHGGDTIALADGSNNEYITKPGDSIGVATFGYLASKYGATCMDGNRPHYVISNWGAGSFSTGDPTDGTYKNVDSPKLYTANENQIGTGASDPDSTKWQAVWDAFVAAHPTSPAWEAVDTTDASVIPGTVTDSIFLTYSTYHSLDGTDGVAGGHAWSYKNGSGYLSSTKGYPYAAAMTFAYYYYPNNTIRLYGCNGSKYINGTDTLSLSFSQQTYPIALTQNVDSTISGYQDVVKYNIGTAGDTTSIDTIKEAVYTFKVDTIGQRYYTAWSAKAPLANGDSVQYRFNFKHYLTEGVIAVETQTFKAGAAEAVVETPAEDVEKGNVGENVANGGDVVGMRTLAKEVHAVKTREIYTLDGLRMNNYVRGINIVRTTYTDGKIETKRIIVR